MDEQKKTAISARLKAPRTGAVAGILFSILLIISVVLLRLSLPVSPRDPGTWLAQSAKSVNLALGLLPFAGISFLWFMGVLRDRMWTHEDRFLITVFLGSGQLFLAMTFTYSAVTDALIMAYEAIPRKLMDSATYTFGRGLTYELTNVYTLRMAGVFVMSTCTIAVRIDIFPRWMAFLGCACAFSAPECRTLGLGVAGLSDMDVGGQRVHSHCEFSTGTGCQGSSVMWKRPSGPEAR